MIINIGRQFGSGGKAVAQELSNILGIPVYDNELIAKCAEQSGYSPELFSQSDEKRRPFSVGAIFGVNRYGGSTHNMLSDSELFRIQSEVIRDIASKGSAIFIGRASNYVLRDMNCLDVFICAPKEVRVKVISERRGISEEEASKLIETKDKGRAEFYNMYTFGHWGKSSDYDLCIDSSVLGYRSTADFIISFASAAGKL